MNGRCQLRISAQGVLQGWDDAQGRMRGFCFTANQRGHTMGLDQLQRLADPLGRDRPREQKTRSVVEGLVRLSPLPLMARLLSTTAEN